MSEPAVDSTASARLALTPSDLASALNLEPADAFPPVFSTLDIIHTAFTPRGATVTATARFVGREGKLFLFEISAADNAGEIGRGTHKRAIVTTERLVAGAAYRGAKA